MEDAIEVIEKDGSYFWIVRTYHTSLMSVVIMMEIVSGSLLHILQGHCGSFLSFYKLSFDDASYFICSVIHFSIFLSFMVLYLSLLYVLYVRGCEIVICYYSIGCLFHFSL